MIPTYFALDMDGLIYNMNRVMSDATLQQVKASIDYCVYAWFETECKACIKEDYRNYMFKYGIDDIIPEELLRHCSGLDGMVEKLLDLVFEISYFLAELAYEYNVEPKHISQVSCKWINHNLAVKLW